MKEIQRTPKEMREAFLDVKRKRMLLGKEDPSNPMSFKRFQLALTRTKMFSLAKDEIAKADLPKESRKERRRMNGRGSVFNMFAIFLAVMLFVGFSFVIVLFSGVFINGFTVVTDNLVGINGQVGGDDINVSTSTTFGNVSDAIGQMRWISFVIIMGMFVGILASAYMVRVHPAWFIFYLILSTIAIVVSIFISNSYDSLLSTDGLGATLQTFRGSSYLIANLHIWTTIVAFVGGIIMFVGVSRDTEQGGLL